MGEDKITLESNENKKSRGAQPPISNHHICEYDYCFRLVEMKWLALNLDRTIIVPRD